MTTPPSVPTRPPHLLLVDDTPADVVLLSEIFALHETPVAITSASDGVAALDLLRHTADLPDLVLLDLNMPRMSGLEALAAIKADADLRHLSVVVLTTSDLSTDIRRAYELGAAAYLTKPRTLRQAMDLAQALHNFCMHTTPLQTLDA